MKEQFGFVESVEVCVRDRYGNVKSQHTLKPSLMRRILRKLHLVPPNCMTYASFQVCSGLIGNTGSYSAFTIIGIGTGTSAAAQTDDATYSHALQAEAKRKAATVSQVTTNSSATNDTLQLVATFSSSDSLSGTSLVGEVGMMNTTSSTSAGACLGMRQQYTPTDSCNWTQGDTYTLTIKIQAEQGS